MHCGILLFLPPLPSPPSPSASTSYAHTHQSHQSDPLEMRILPRMREALRQMDRHRSRRHQEESRGDTAHAYPPRPCPWAPLLALHADIKAATAAYSTFLTATSTSFLALRQVATCTRVRDYPCPSFD